MNEEICKIKYTSEKAEDLLGEQDFWEEFYDPAIEVKRKQDVEHLMSDKHFWEDKRSGFFNQTLVAVECIKCGKIVKLNENN